MATTRLFAREDWAEWMIEWHAEGRCEITEELFEEYLDVLPPAFMGKRVQLADGSKVYADFGFVEGADRITAFWREKTGKPGEYRYFCQYTNQWSKG